jgi:hypothetical protein
MYLVLLQDHVEGIEEDVVAVVHFGHASNLMHKAFPSFQIDLLVDVFKQFLHFCRVHFQMHQAEVGLALSWRPAACVLTLLV